MPLVQPIAERRAGVWVGQFLNYSRPHGKL